MTDQLDLTSLHTCPVCHGRGQVDDHDGSPPYRCPTCLGTGSVDYDPDDTSEIPF